MSFVTPSDTPTANLLLYGPGGSGKTTGAASGPGPVLYLNAESENALYHARTKQPKLLEVDMKGLSAMTAVYNEVKDHPEDWGTVVADPVADMYRILIEESTNRALNPALDAYRDAGTHIERWCRSMCDLPVNFVVVCHDWPVTDESTGTVERLPYTGSARNATLANKLLAMFDIVGYTGVVEVKEGDQSEFKYMAQLKNANGRRGKDRFNVLGKSEEVDLSRWLGLIAASKSSTPQEATAA